MEFEFDVNEVLTDTISVITGSQIQSNQRRNHHELQEIIDTIGIKSAKAQGLSAPITSLSKLKINSHRIYVLTDRTDTLKAKSVIGFIKVGTKQLFVLDHEGTHHQTHPLCVLDFFVHESQQRKGHGLKLFKYMLQAEHVHPPHIAIDRPSQKFTSFLRKHFNLWATIPQVNNFVVFEGFFKNRGDSGTGHKKSVEYDDFRPLSRAFTEGMLHHKKNFEGGTLDGIRPASTVFTNGYYHNGQSQRTMQSNRRKNIFSRHANENQYISSHPERRKRSVRSRQQQEEIITNPYRDVQYSKTRLLEDARNQAFENQGNFQIAISPSSGSSKTDSPEHDDIIFDRNHNLSPPNSKTHLFQYNSEVQTKKDHSNHGLAEMRGEVHMKTPQREIFEAKQGCISLKSYRYEKPSDMIDELKKKDREITGRRTSNFHQYGLGSTSWNVFGIPSPSRFANR